MHDDKRNKSPCLIIFEMISISAVNDTRYKIINIATTHQPIIK
jgi:hypothetical protein